MAIDAIRSLKTAQLLKVTVELNSISKSMGHYRQQQRESLCHNQANGTGDEYLLSCWHLKVVRKSHQPSDIDRNLGCAMDLHRTYKCAMAFGYPEESGEAPGTVLQEPPAI